MKRILTVCLVLAACTDGPDPMAPIGSSADLRPMAGSADRGRPSFMSWNINVGADIDRMLGAPAEAIPFVAAELWAEVQATSFEERAAAIAAQIAHFRPHLVGLQEVSTFRIQSPGDVLIGNPVPARDIALDFLDVLMRALADRGLEYRVAAVTLNHEIELPMVTATGLDDIRLSDQDVVLARADIAIDAVASRAFAWNLEVPLPTGSLTIRRGWTTVDARIGATAVRFVTTHLEPPEYAPQIQEAQAAELIAALDPRLATVLTGDLNSAADGSSTGSYQAFLAAGFIDTWAVDMPNRDGFTCCHPKTLRGDDERLSKRIDYVLVRGFAADEPGSRGGIDAVVVGEERRDRTTSGLWPSDHAGVFARLHAPVTGGD